MTNFDDLDPELTVQERSDPAFRHLISDLQNICSTNISAQPRADIARRLGLAPAKASATVAARGPILVAPLPPSHRGHLRRPRASGWLLSAAAAAFIALGGTFGYLHLQTPATASAAQVLRRAALAVTAASPGQVIYEVTIVRLLRQPSAQVDARDITAEQWTQLAADGNPAHRSPGIQRKSGRGRENSCRCCRLCLDLQPKLEHGEQERLDAR
ncbi:MAG TPA: hypothetical protein DEV93_00795 [Chloroflexi bacterium]|jgi:hypothetical protein|nr:hypothetical protein [Chloroflexota bacterium]